MRALRTWVMLAVVLASAGVAAGTGPSSAQSLPVELTNDAGAPLFGADPPLAPGRPRSACLSVTAEGAGPDDEVRLLVGDVTGSLAPDLQLEILIGDSGRDCSGFTGSRIYAGTVDALARLRTTGVPTGWRPGGRSRRSFRFVVTLSDRAAGAGRQAGASFVWRLDADAPPSGPPTAGPTAPPSTRPTAVPTTVPPTGPTASPRPSSVATFPAAVPTPGGTATPGDPVPTRAPGTGSPSPGTGSGAGSGSDSGSGSGPRPGQEVTLARSLPARVGRTVAGVLAKPQFTLAPLLLVMIFLLVQHRIDARDPKLAQASGTWRDRTVLFPRDYPGTDRR